MPANSGGDPAPPQRIQVVATIYPLAYFTERIGGGSVEVRTLVRPGVEAHAFEPTPRDMQALELAQLVVINGLGLEQRIERAMQHWSEDRRRRVVVASDASFAIRGVSDHHEEGEEHEGEGHEAEAEGEEEVNPHMWLDPLLAIRQVERVRDALASLDPVNGATYVANAASLVEELRALGHEFEKGLAACAHDHFVTTHAAYGYLAEQYGLEEIPIAGLSPEIEPSPRKLSQMATQVTALGLRHVLAEPAVNQRFAGALAAEAGLTLLPIHQLESATAEELRLHGDYFGLMRDNLRSLTIALDCGNEAT